MLRWRGSPPSSASGAPLYSQLHLCKYRGTFEREVLIFVFGICCSRTRRSGLLVDACWRGAWWWCWLRTTGSSLRSYGHLLSLLTWATSQRLGYLETPAGARGQQPRTAPSSHRVPVGLKMGGVAGQGPRQRRGMNKGKGGGEKREAGPWGALCPSPLGEFGSSRAPRLCIVAASSKRRVPGTSHPPSAKGGSWHHL